MIPAMVSRREFLVQGGRCAVLLGAAALAPPCLRGAAFAAPAPPGEPSKSAPRARFWDPAAPDDRGDKTVRCRLCAHRCVIPDGERGRCRGRMNAGGELRSLVYGRPLAMNLDPIEKKPFFHFLPGAAAFSFGTAGCPLRCSFCQNWQLSQSRPEDHSAPFTPPGKMVEQALSRRAPVLAFTYNEPTVQAEYVIDTALAAKEKGVRSVIVSSGYMNEAPLREMCRALAAVKIDLKGFSPDFYRKVCEADLAPVLRSIRQVAKSGVHLELVNLVVPTLNDSPKMLEELAGWVMGETGPDTPLHFTRFHPDYRLQNLPPTPVATLEAAREAAMKKGLRYAYVGNVPGHPGSHTYCPQCGKAVVERDGFFVTAMNVGGGKCRFCGRAIAGVWA
jgi:pyruvate formate lyase activating enzyme